MAEISVFKSTFEDSTFLSEKFSLPLTWLNLEKFDKTETAFHVKGRWSEIFFSILLEITNFSLLFIYKDLLIGPGSEFLPTSRFCGLLFSGCKMPLPLVATLASSEATSGHFWHILHQSSRLFIRNVNEE